MLRKASAFGRGGFCRMASASRYLSIPLPNGSRISLILSLPFALIHVAALLIFFIPFHWYYLVICLVLLVVRMFFVTAGYQDRKSTRLNSSHVSISYAVFCLNKKHGL